MITHNTTIEMFFRKFLKSTIFKGHQPQLFFVFVATGRLDFAGTSRGLNQNYNNCNVPRKTK